MESNQVPRGGQELTLRVRGGRGEQVSPSPMIECCCGADYDAIDTPVPHYLIILPIPITLSLLSTPYDNYLPNYLLPRPFSQFINQVMDYGFDHGFDYGFDYGFRLDTVVVYRNFVSTRVTN